MAQPFETFEHGADIGIRGYGETPEAALSNLLKALSNLMVENPDFLKRAPLQSYPVEVQADFPDELLVVFVNQVLSLSALEGVLLYEFKGEVSLEDERCYLKGEVSGIPLDTEVYGYGVEVKGATFTLASFTQVNHHYVAQCVVDV
jgi:SHS2 domain-containing protein